MKKSKRPRASESADQKLAAPPQKKFVWWPWAAALGALFLAFEIYDPALHGAFVLDDRNLPFFTPGFERQTLLAWLGNTRPILMLSFWLNFQASGTEPYFYHVTNVLLHFLTAVLVTFIAARLLEWAGVKDGIARPTLGAFAGALFLVHPLQTESVAYVASRSDVLSTLFYYGAYCVFLYRRTESITWVRALAVLALFGAAVLSKQPALTLPLLLVFTDLYWVPGGLRANLRLYGMLAVAGLAGAIYVVRGLLAADTVLHVQGMTPGTYFFTECRVVWTYVRFFFLPFGQNADPEVAVSQSLLDHGAILALAAWLAVVAAAWFYRRRWPLASFGMFMFLLLLAPTSSFIPIADVLQERRLYLPFLGFTLVCLEFLRRLRLQQRLLIEVPILLLLMALTYQRSALWGDPMALWQYTVAKSPGKVRPRFPARLCVLGAGTMRSSSRAITEVASHLAPPDYRLLVDWGTALDCGNRVADALEKLQAAARLERDPQAWAWIGQVYGKRGKTQEALEALDQADKIDPNFAMAHAIRGNVYQTIGDCRAVAEYQRALDLEPSYAGLAEALASAQAKCR